MDKFIKYLNDEGFIHWICNNDPEHHTSGDESVSTEEKETMLTLKKILTELNIREAQLSQSERDKILNRLLQEIKSTRRDAVNRASTIRIISQNITRYAASILIFIAIGAAIYLFLQDNRNDINEYSYAENNKSIQLILADGRKLDIDGKKANIQYNLQGGIIINQNDTLVPTLPDKDAINRVSTEKSKSQMNSVIVPYGRSARLKLSDGSIVYLNAGTQFSYPQVADKSREVLLKGEAFFQVVKNAEKPFIVKTSEKGYTVSVLGTKFNVSAYPSDPKIETVLEEGSVLITYPTVETQLIASLQISPGQLSSWDKNNYKQQTTNVDTKYYTSWIHGNLLFDKEDFSTVVKKVERYYDIKIVFEDALKQNIKISGTLNLNTDLEETIAVLKATSATTVEESERGYYVIK